MKRKDKSYYIEKAFHCTFEIIQFHRIYVKWKVAFYVVLKKRPLTKPLNCNIRCIMNQPHKNKEHIHFIYRAKSLL